MTCAYFKIHNSPIKMMKSIILPVSGGLSVNPLSSRCGNRYFSIKEVSLAVLYKKGVLNISYRKIF